MNKLRKSQPLTKKRAGASKMALALLAAAMTALIGTTGVAYATNGNQNSSAQVNGGYGGNSASANVEINLNNSPGAVVHVVFNWIFGS